MIIIIAKRIASGKKPPTITSLYKQLSKQYNNKGQLFPKKPEIFMRRIHRELGLDKNSKNYEPYFYRLVGRYDKMTIDSLAKGISVSSVSTGKENCWLFMRLNSVIADSKPINTYPVVQKHLYLLAQELKKEYSREIIFISFDKDTLVIMCKDNTAEQKIARFVNRINGKSVP